MKPRQGLKKAFLDSSFWLLAVSEYHFLKIDKNRFLLLQNILYVSWDALSYIKSFLRLQETFFICTTCFKNSQNKIYKPKMKPRQGLKKAFFNNRYWLLVTSEYDFLKIDKNCFLLSQNLFYVSYGALNFIKRYLRL